MPSSFLWLVKCAEGHTIRTVVFSIAMASFGLINYLHTYIYVSVYISHCCHCAYRYTTNCRLLVSLSQDKILWPSNEPTAITTSEICTNVILALCKTVRFRFLVRPNSMLIPKLVKEMKLAHSKLAGRHMHGIVRYGTHTGRPTHMSRVANYRNLHTSARNIKTVYIVSKPVTLKFLETCQ